ncbi:MAG TPA: hypothetical protein VKB93_18835 [Thermoanaerobaculia bacterium]|nr:hypothetical protein [Thermoanaerobaculia bacterium]
MKRLLLLLALLACAMPLIAEIAVGLPVYGDAPGYQVSPAVASDGDGYFAVWLDQRGGGRSLMATRLSEAGEALDRMGILLVPSYGGYAPMVVWSGASYVIVWQEPAATRPVIKALRVDRDGRAGGSPREIASGSVSSVAGNGARVIVAYAAAEIRAAVLDSDANVLADFALAGTDAERYGPLVAASRDEFVIAWHRGHARPVAIEAVRLTGGGTRIDASPREIGTGTLAEFASDGRDFNFIAYDTPGRLVSRKVSADLASSFPEYPLGALTHPVLVWTGTRYVAFATAQRDFIRFSIDANGQPSVPVAERKIVDSDTSGSFDGATNGRTLLHVWSARAPEHSSPALFASADDAPAQLVSLSANEQLEPRIAKGNGVDLVVWTEERGLYATRIDAAGRSLDGRGIFLAKTTNSAWPILPSPAVAFDGRQFVVAYRNAAVVLVGETGTVRFISPAEGLLPDTLPLETMSEPPSLIRAGEETFVAWANGDTLRAAKISATRAFAGSPVTVAKTSDVFEKIDGIQGAWNGTELLLAWAERVEGIYCSCGPVKRVFKRIRAARVNANLTLLDTEPRLIGEIKSAGEVETALASDGGEWLVAWRFENELRARRIARDGVPQGSDGVVIGSSAVRPALLWDGVRYALAWTTLPAGDVRYAYLPRSGPLTLSEPITVVPANNGGSLSLASISSGKFALAYSRIVHEEPYGGVRRAFVRELGGAGKRRSAR